MSMRYTGKKRLRRASGKPLDELIKDRKQRITVKRDNYERWIESELARITNGIPRDSFNSP